MFRPRPDTLRNAAGSAIFLFIMQQNFEQSQSHEQRMILSPQMRIYLKILQMPLMDLKQALEEEMLENPALEEVPSQEKPDTETPDAERAEKIDLEKAEQEEDESALPPVEDEPLADVKELERRKSYQESILAQAETLADHIRAQTLLLDLAEDEREAAEVLIGSLNENGWLSSPVGELALQAALPQKTMERVLEKLRLLEPAGIFALDLRECLLIQLAQSKDPRSPLAREMIRDHIDLVQRKSFTELARVLKAPADEIGHAFRLIQECDPKPGKSFALTGPLQVVPDAVISYDVNDPRRYRIELRSSGLPRLKLSSEYRRMLKDKKLDGDARKFVKDKTSQAEWFLEALKNREDTLSAVISEILKRQREFLEKGFAALKPLRMREVAEKLGLHESTVSRAVAGKFIQTPLGTCPLRAFFSGRLSGSSIEEESQKSVMEKIRSIIGRENPKRPLSDQAITELLKGEGIDLARRTVAKYREMMKILPTHLRKEQ